MIECKTKIERKKYRRKSLKARVKRLLRINNGITVVSILVLMLFTTMAIVSLVSNGFSKVTANLIAADVSDNFQKSEKMYQMNESLNDMSNDEKKSLGLEMINIDGKKYLDSTKVDILGEDHSIFEYEVKVGETVIYNSFKATNEDAMLGIYDKGMNDYKNFSASAPIVDLEGNKVGTIMVYISPIILALAFGLSIALGLGVFIFNQFFSSLISSIMSKAVSRPLEVLAKQIEDLASDDLEDAFNVVLEVKRPVSEVVSLKDSTNKIMQKIAEYYEITTAQNEELQAQRDELESQRDELESQNDQLQTTSHTLQSMNNAYLSRTMKLQNLLDNVGQGFMTFGQDLKINSEYSLTCLDMLCDCDDHIDLAGKKVTDFIFDEPDQKDFIESLLIKIMTGSDNERELFMPLLPEEVELHGKIHRIEYKLVTDEQNRDLIMLIMTDISETRDLESQMMAERDLLQMIVKVLLNRDDFLSLYHDFLLDMNRSFEQIEDEEYEDILRKIHTYKGSFSQYYMSNISAMLNTLEDEIYEVGTIDYIRNIERSRVLDALNQDIENIKRYTSDDILDENELYAVKEEKIIEIEQKIKSILPATEFNKVIPIIKSIRYKSVKEGLKQYPDYVTKLSERMEKSVLPFEIQGDEVFVDFDVYQNLFKNMVHLFRNAVDHGIETEDERMETGKSQAASISCYVNKKDDTCFEIIIHDDGRGIDPEIVKASALEKGLIQETDLDRMSDSELLELIFQQKFSTKNEATAISGRGVGLASVKDQVEHLGGSLQVASELGNGTTFTLSLPILQGTDIIFFEPDQFIDHIDQVASGYLKDLSIAFDSTERTLEDKIVVHRVSSLINVKGSLDGLLVVSTNESLSKKLVDAFIIGGVSQEEVEDYYEDVLGEITNTILGNVLGSLEEEGIYLTMGVPVMLSNRNAYIKYSNRQIYSIKYHSGQDIITFSILMTENVDLSQDLSFEDTSLFFDKEEE